MKGYKAFKKGLICDPTGKNPFQYAENTVFEQNEEAIICNSGFHFCKNPLDVLAYYPLINNNGDMTEFAEVEALDECETDDNKKFCTKKLKIGAKVSFPALVQASVNFELEKTQTSDTKVKTTSKNSAQIGSSGNFAQIGSSGNYAQIGSSGDSAQIGSSGKYAKIGSSGNYAQIGSSGDSARIGSSGNSAQIGSSGDSAKIASTGKYAVVCCAGNNSRAKAKKGSWITLSEWKYNEEEDISIPVCVKTEYVDGEKIKEDTFYKLKNGEFVVCD